MCCAIKHNHIRLWSGLFHLKFLMEQWLRYPSRHSRIHTVQFQGRPHPHCHPLTHYRINDIDAQWHRCSPCRTYHKQWPFLERWWEGAIGYDPAISMKYIHIYIYMNYCLSTWSSGFALRSRLFSLACRTCDVFASSTYTPRVCVCEHLWVNEGLFVDVRALNLY